MLNLNKNNTMVIDIRKHYFRDSVNGGELNELGKFHVGEIVTDWNGITGCILMIFRNGDVRTDSNGMGDISKLRKVRSKSKIMQYLNELHNADISFMQNIHRRELEQIRLINE